MGWRVTRSEARRVVIEGDAWRRERMPIYRKRLASPGQVILYCVHYFDAEVRSGCRESLICRS